MVKPCPFCGNTNAGLIFVAQTEWRLAHASAICDNDECGARGPEIKLQDGEAVRNGRLIEKWNARKP